MLNEALALRSYPMTTLTTARVRGKHAIVTVDVCLMIFPNLQGVYAIRDM